MKKKPETYHSSIMDDILNDITPEEFEKTEKIMSLALKIDKAIKAKGMRKIEFAKKLGKLPSEITKWLSGTHNFTISTLIDIEQVLDVQLVDAGIEDKYQNVSVEQTFKGIYSATGLQEAEIKKEHAQNNAIYGMLDYAIPENEFSISGLQSSLKVPSKPNKQKYVEAA